MKTGVVRKFKEDWPGGFCRGVEIRSLISAVVPIAPPRFRKTEAWSHDSPRKDGTVSGSHTEEYSTGVGGITVIAENGHFARFTLGDILNSSVLVEASVSRPCYRYSVFEGGSLGGPCDLPSVVSGENKRIIEVPKGKLRRMRNKLIHLAGGRTL